MTDFLKMHGLGNDFIIFDWRNGGPAMVSEAAARALADRRTGIGCDQILVIRPSDRADIRMDILNHDGSPSGACGNGTRCVADLVMESGMGHGTDRPLTIETDGADLRAWRAGADISVDMGPVATGWADVPLAHQADTLAVPLGIDGLGDAVCHSLGNPHAVVFVDDAEAVDLMLTAAASVEQILSALDPNLPVTFMGGLAAEMLPYLTDHTKLRLVAPKHPPEEGALLHIWQKMKSKKEMHAEI